MKKLTKQLVSILAALCLLMPCSLKAQKPDNSIRPNATARPIPIGYPSDIKINYIRTWVPSIPIADPSTVTANGDVNAVKQTTQYLDGLGRPIQSVGRQVSPLMKDEVTAISYDDFGQETFKYLPYTSNNGNANDNDGKFKLNPFNSQHSFYQSTTDETIYYGKTNYELSPLHRVMKTMDPGNSWTGSDRGITNSYAENTAADNVQNWIIALAPGSSLTRGTPFEPGMLYKYIIEDEQGKKVITFKNKEGKVLLKKVELTTGTASYDGWLCTFYVYDDLGNLRVVIPPKAVDLIKNNWNITTPIMDELCYRYEYDHRQRLITKKLPGAKAVEMVYDIRDRLVFSQDGNIAGSNQWHTTLYDDQNRPVMTALYTTTQSADQLRSALSVGQPGQTVQHTIAAANDLEVPLHDGRAIYKAKNSITFTEGFESGDTDMETELNAQDVISVQANNPLPLLDETKLYPLTYTYYDDYTYAGKKTHRPNDFTKPSVDTDKDYYEERATKTSTRTHGLTTGTKVRVLGADQWLHTTTYYDDKARVIQIIADNPAGGEDAITRLYDFSGKLLSSYQHSRNPASVQTPDMEVLTMSKYDHTGRVTDIIKQVNNGTKRHIVHNEYNESGQLKSKDLGQMPDDSWLENLAYEYNIRGWLRSINKDYVNGSITRYFGQEVNYDHGFDNKLYNGHISGTKWKGFNDPVARAYGYSYDGIGRMMKADFNQFTGSNWDKSAGINYDVKMGNGLDPYDAYDANGNIKGMQQWGFKTGGSVQIDNLSYSYDKPELGLYSNKLMRVQDVVANDPAAALGDFMDQNPSASTDYLYDDNGNLTKDENKQIQQITYNHLNLPKLISFTGKGSIEYIYDASGNKQKKIVTDQTTAPAKITTTVYSSGFIYEDNLLKIFSHEEGRVRAVYAANAPVDFVYDYFIKDHLGNIRVVITEQTDIHTYLASMETERAPAENALFNNIDASRIKKPSGYPQDATTSKNTFVAKLNATHPDRRIGPSIVLKVMAGDTIRLGAKAFYKSAGSKSPKATAPAEDMLTSLVAAFSGPGNSPGSKITARQNGASPFDEGFVNNTYNRLKEKEPASPRQPDRPKAYLNFVLFNEQMKLVEENSGVKQVQAQPDQLQTLTQGNVVIKKSGFLYVYTSNESPQDVFFDNVILEHIPGHVLEETHFYPFGLVMKGISTKAVGKPENKFLFNGKELQSNEFTTGTGLEWYDYTARMYDAQIGRWHVKDPMAEKSYGITPYNYALNNPVYFTDPTGMTAEDHTFSNGRTSTDVNFRDLDMQSETNHPLSEFERRMRSKGEGDLKLGGHRPHVIASSSTDNDDWVIRPGDKAPVWDASVKSKAEAEAKGFIYVGPQAIHAAADGSTYYFAPDGHVYDAVGMKDVVITNQKTSGEFGPWQPSAVGWQVSGSLTAGRFTGSFTVGLYLDNGGLGFYRSYAYGMSLTSQKFSAGASASMFMAKYTGSGRTDPNAFKQYSMTTTANRGIFTGYYSQSANMVNGKPVYGQGFEVYGLGLSTPGYGVNHEVGYTNMTYFKIN